MCKDPTPIEHFWLMQMLENFGAKQNLYFIFFAPSLLKNRSRAAKRGWYIYRSYKQIYQFSKNWNIARKIMCFILNVIIARQKFSAHLIYPFQSLAIVRINFEAGI